MITLRVIRGHRLKLWAKRLNLHQSFIDIIDVKGMHYVHSEQPIGNEYTRLVILTKVKGTYMPLVATFLVTEDLIQYIVETMELKEEFI